MIILGAVLFSAFIIISSDMIITEIQNINKTVVVSDKINVLDKFLFCFVFGIGLGDIFVYALNKIVIPFLVPFFIHN